MHAGGHTGYWAALAHRASGLLLALFLPLHFLALGLAIEGAVPLDSFLRWSDRPLVKAAEWALVVLLTLHVALGLRVLTIELLPWRGHLKRTIGWGAGAALVAGALFLMRAV